MLFKGQQFCKMSALMIKAKKIASSLRMTCLLCCALGSLSFPVHGAKSLDDRTNPYVSDSEKKLKKRNKAQKLWDKGKRGASKVKGKVTKSADKKRLKAKQKDIAKLESRAKFTAEDKQLLAKEQLTADDLKKLDNKGLSRSEVVMLHSNKHSAKRYEAEMAASKTRKDLKQLKPEERELRRRRQKLEAQEAKVQQLGGDLPLESTSASGDHPPSYGKATGLPDYDEAKTLADKDEKKKPEQ